VCLISCATVKGQDRGPNYFPTKVGAKWIYDSDGREESEEITKVEYKDGAFLVTVHRVDGFGRESDSKLKVSSDGVVQLAGLIGEKHPPELLVKLPHKPHQKWTTFFGKAEAFGPERLMVAAGAFEVVRVEATIFTLKGQVITVNSWYAPKVGLVKETRGEHVRVLKSFTTGKE
jgi:hypothetical protein